jgi:hypothetical protein
VVQLRLGERGLSNALSVTNGARSGERDQVWLPSVTVTVPVRFSGVVGQAGPMRADSNGVRQGRILYVHSLSLD